MKKIWAVRKDAEAVSPVIATILMVAITVVLAAVLYVMVLGFGGTGTSTPTISMTKATITSGYKFTFQPGNQDISWDDVTLVLTDGTNTVSWALTTEDLNDGAGDRYSSIKSLGTLAVNMTVIDIAGDGKMNPGDSVSFTATSFSDTTEYTIDASYDPSGGRMGGGSF